ncbi:MAG TPA: NAD-dependent succinate-semialdehyde dehydrogenase [Tepidisphaeraceae bacterium]|jgi:succinate-semialdehyde dehydrogenase/glutarate-semialdehyde dehydrogenase|nr:NAD-dependent succinate-semialdehyde dehydrogenase [Tepidisphaeraceae bacterium]
MKAINPTTEEVIAEYPDHTQQQVEQLLEQAESAFAKWRGFSFDQRGELLRRVGELLLQQKTDLSTLMTREMGKTIAGAEAEIEKCATACDYFANHAQRLLAIEEVPTDATRSYVRFDPLGPILAIMPWNFPFWQVFRFAAPSLMAGNVAVLKHAWNVPGCGLAIERIFREAGFPQGVLTNLLLDNNAAEALIAHPRIRAVTLTGSERAGKAVGSAAGRVIKKSVLELGGSDPFIVCPDVNVPGVAMAAAGARNINAGQSCIAAKRFLVHHSIADEFERLFADRMASLKMGDPMDRNTDIGPLARADLRDNLDDQVKRTLAAGARLLCGGKKPATRGLFYPPTVLANVRPGMSAFDEETFGPVAAVTRVKNMDEAIQLANRSRYGLGASIWTNDFPQAERLAAQIESGNVFVNGAVKSDPRLPFGGIKNSGYGRELAQVGIREFVNIKAVWIK